ncbi:hypothetical protein C8F04DRAFT_1331490 [Mycena alexandri]|uniref:DUF6532 domain-containing protein n=1 Tax=Mycena alexandri TaxID=1745969 RepID=A0AAD6RZ36_9AGAR|nr:hypothetical protein C8F04DRAFT_1331490 [Mycena alexandri]
MPAGSTNTTLTPAEKRKITMAAKAETERQEQAAFVAASKKAGGRAAKAKAKEQAVWKADQPGTTRKRTLSTAEPSATTKKARGTKATSDSEVEATPEIPKASVVKARKHAPATIQDSDESDAGGGKKRTRLDFTNLPTRSKAKPVAATAKKLGNVSTQAKPSVKNSKAGITKATPARVVAESDSDSEDAPASEEKSEDGESDGDHIEDVAPNENEFMTEVPHVISRKSKFVKVDNHDVEMEDTFAENLFDSDQESVKIDKPRTKRRQLKEEPDSDDNFPDAPPRMEIIDDSDVDVPSVRARTSGHSSRSRRSSASSWSSGRDLRVPDSDPEDAVDNMSRPAAKKRNVYEDNLDMQMHEAIAKGLTTVARSTHSRRSSASSRAAESDAEDSDDGPAPKKPRKVSAARQKQADMERPEVRPGPAATGLATQLNRVAAATVDAASRPESDWHVSARILFPAPGKDIGLTGQTDELKAVLHGCIDFIKLSLFFDDAYPVVLARGGFARTFLLMAAQHPAAIHIKDRLTNDMGFATRLADIPLDRINTTRGDIRQVAAQDIGGLYGFALSPPEEVKTIVNGRLQDHKYIFPVDPITNRLKTELPFQHESIVSVLRKAVFTGQFKTKNLHLFSSTNDKHPERLEVPDAMLCLGATGVYAGLTAYRATGKHQKIPFTASAYEDVYRNHMRTLSDTRAHSPKALHLVLHDLYKLVTETTTAAPNAAGSSAILINLVDIPDSD